jgi:hypothetical protein
MFKHGVALGVRGKPEFFSRLLAEFLFASFQAYENALGTKILPAVEDSIEVKKPSFIHPRESITSQKTFSGHLLQSAAASRLYEVVIGGVD